MTIRFDDVEQRRLVIRNFRNLGPFCTSDKAESNEDKAFVKINRSLDIDVLGGIIQLIGVNNSGKSNVLDAFECYETKEFKDSDYTDFTLVDEPIKPHIGMNLANGKYRESFMAQRKKYDGKWNSVLLALLLELDNYDLYQDYIENENVTYTEYVDFLKEILLPTFNSVISEELIKFIKFIFCNRADLQTAGIYMDGVFEEELPELSSYVPAPIDKEGLVIQPNIMISGIGTIVDDSIFDRIEEHHDPNYEGDETERIKASLETISKYVSDVIVAYFPEEQLTTDASDEFVERYGYRISNNVYRYTPDEPIRSTDLTCDPLNPNKFFINLLYSMDIEPGVLKTAYSGNKSRRHMLSKAMNEELELMSQELNDLLNIEEEKYHLRVVLESNNMEFIIEYGDGIARNLDKQSQGFRWLFNLYFNLINSLEFDLGDIVLIDEFGDSLGFSTVEVLTRKLRDYGRNNGITFILATQNPMAVDINHLDEVRLVVPQDNGSSIIINEFDQCGDAENHDVLLPVLNGLMVSRNFMRTENRRTVFVEGVTDYFYLNAFAEVLRSKGKDIDIDFIPIKGLGIKKDDTIQLVKQILSIERNPVLLIDSDGTGKAARKTIEKEKSNRITVADIGELFEGQKSEIEDLFSEEDFKRFCLSKEVKRFDEAFCVGYSIVNDYESLSDETKENFEKVIEYIATI